MKRISKHEYYAEIAKVVAKRATCPKLAVGAVLVSPWNSIIATGYNGAPKWMDHCLDIGCNNDDAGHCTRAVHAEANAIAQAALMGTSTKDSTMYCTQLPCLRCLNLMVNAGVKNVFYLDASYRPEAVKAAASFIIESCINLEKLEA